MKTNPAITIENAEVKSASITVKILTLNARQLTLSVFRQIPEGDIFCDLDMTLKGTPWGRVNYFWGDQPRRERIHLLWECDKELRRDILTLNHCPYLHDLNEQLDNIKKSYRDQNYELTREMKHFEFGLSSTLSSLLQNGLRIKGESWASTIGWNSSDGNTFLYFQDSNPIELAKLTTEGYYQKWIDEYERIKNENPDISTSLEQLGLKWNEVIQLKKERQSIYDTHIADFYHNLPQLFIAI